MEILILIVAICYLLAPFVMIGLVLWMLFSFISWMEQPKKVEIVRRRR